MPVGKGFTSRLAVGKETTWGTAVQVTRLIPFTSEGLTKELERVDDSSTLVGTAAKRASYIAGGQVSGDVSADLTYTDFDEILEAAFGVKTVDTTTGVTTYDLAEDVDISLTVAVEKGVSIHEFVGCKVSRLSISTGDNRLQISVSFLGKDYTRAGLNTGADFDALSSPGRAILLPDCTLQIGANTYNFSELNFTLDNKLQAVRGNSKLPVSIDRNGKREMSFSITLPKYEADNFYSDFENGAETSVVLTATDGTNTFKLILPKVIVQTVDTSVSGEGIIPQKVDFIVLRGEGALGVTEEARIEVS